MGEVRPNRVKAITWKVGGGWASSGTLAGYNTMEVNKDGSGTIFSDMIPNGLLQCIKLVEDATETPTDNWDWQLSESGTGLVLASNTNETASVRHYPSALQTNSSGTSLIPLKDEVLRFDVAQAGSSNKLYPNIYYI